MKVDKQEFDEAVKRLQEYMADQLVSYNSPKVYAKVTHVARSGMSRSIAFYIIRDNQPIEVTWLFARIYGATLDRKNGGMKVSGCGMDMGFNVIYETSRVIYKGTTFDTGAMNNKDRGYVLKHEWF